MLDARLRPYFLWDEELTVDQFRARLRDDDPEVRGYYLGKLMRQAKPDDVFLFVSLDELTAQLPSADRYLGPHTRVLEVAARQVEHRWPEVV
ncbi:hypothetical protein BH11MYX1_BH11MYX1_48130 [soil metagenome]